MRPLPAVDPGIPEHRSATRYLWWLAGRIRVPMVTAMLLAVLWMVCQALVPAAVGRAIDAGLTHRDGRALLSWSGVLLGLGLAQAAAGIGRHRFAVFNWLAAAFRTIQVTVRQANRLGAALPRRLDAGEVMAIGTADISHIGGALDITARGSGALVAIATVTVVLLRTSVPLGLVVVLGVPLLMAVVGLLIRPLHHRQQAYRDQQGRLTGRAGDLVAGLRVLRGIGGEPVVAARYRADSQALRTAGVRVATVESLLEAAQVLLPGAFLVLVTWLGARFALTGRITVGQLVSFYGYAAFLVAPLRTLTEALDKLTRGHVAARRVVTMLSARGDLPDPVDPVPPPPPGPLVDPRSGMVIRPGELTAVAAADPADAVAIMERLGRYVDPAGPEAVTLSGVPLRVMALAAVRARILVADNDARLFAGPLRTELDPAAVGPLRTELDPAAVGGPPDDRAAARLADALRVAAAEDVVAGLPGGLDAEVAERGRSFSGGQQQRLRLARALLADPEILLLIEPTSAVDAHTEARIAARLGAARTGRTTVVCSTSPLVLDRADRVLFVQDGKVVAEGTHRALLATAGYARTVVRMAES